MSTKSSRRVLRAQDLEALKKSDLIAAFEHIKEGVCELRVDARVAILLERTLVNLCRGPREIRAIIGMDDQISKLESSETPHKILEPTGSQKERLVRHIFFSVFEWYCSTAVEDIPPGSYPMAIFVLETYFGAFMEDRMPDLVLMRMHSCQGKNSKCLPDVDEEKPFGDLASYYDSWGELRPYVSETGPANSSASEKIASGNLDEMPLEDTEDEKDWECDTEEGWYTVRYKLGQLFLYPTIDRPRDAFFYLESLAIEHYLKHNDWDKALQNHPDIMGMWLDAANLGGHCDGALLDLLHNFIHIFIVAAQEGNDAIKIRAVLGHLDMKRRFGELRPYEADMATVILRDNYIFLSESSLRQLLARPDRPLHPTYVAVGGEQWLRDMRMRFVCKRARQCSQCWVTDKKLMICSRCGWDYYCSTACQKLNWPSHKSVCRAAVHPKAVTKELKSRGLKDVARCAAEWAKWRRFTHDFALWHALRLNRAPQRGRTHVVVREMRWAPQAADVRFRFATARCGVFEIARALPDIERIMGWPPGHGARRVQELLDAFDSIPQDEDGEDGEGIPLLDLTYGAGPMKATLDTGRLPLMVMKDLVYEPRWRNFLNAWDEDPPEQLVLPSGAPDAEFFY